MRSSLAECGLDLHSLVVPCFYGVRHITLIPAVVSQLAALYNFPFIYPDEIRHTAGSAIGAKELTRHKIEENVGTAAAALCFLSSGDGYEPGRCFRDDVVGIVALLGTVTDRKISR